MPIQDVERVEWRAFVDAGRSILNLKRPVVLQGCASNWGSSNWTPSYLCDAYGDIEVEVKLESVEKRQGGPPLCEGQCEYRMCTMKEFCEWAECLGDSEGGQKSAQGGLDGVPLGQWFGYVDYKYFPQLFDDGDAAYAAVRWQDLGINADPKESVFWMGTPGAATPLHYDSYGSNVVLQVYGKKEWLLFPPESSEWLKPCRIPFEESSIWSQVGISGVDEFAAGSNKADKNVLRAILQGGEVLFVPHQWWHQVRCISTAISVNLWTKHSNDDLERLRERVSRTLLMSAHAYHASQEAITPSPHPARSIVMPARCAWLNPNETMWNWSEVLKSINEAMRDVKRADASSPGTGAPSLPEIDPAQLVQAICHPKAVSVICDILLGNSG